ncbi:MAG TPA: alginate export family protein, partial [Steroidobacteraceae bacterium]|nr:alginate export family protein [Steroidobacteraceae bacterium]
MQTRTVGSKPATWLVPGMVVLAVVSIGQVRAEGADSLKGAFSGGKLILDARLRTENVDQEPLPDDAHAITLRTRLGFETAKAWNTTLLVEGEAVVPIQDDYRPDPAVAEMVTFPVVPDPEAYEANRFQLVNTSLPGTTLTLGRQRILLDDQRFVGNVGWRQNEQTFDGFRVVNKSVKNLVLDATYLNRVNRVFGPDSPQGDYQGDSALLNASYQTPLGKITGFGYLLQFDDIVGVPAAVRDSTSTYGVRFAGEKPAGKVKLAYAASWATQSDAGDNPLSFDLDYMALELGATLKQFGLTAGIEVLDGNGTKGFTTPLATLHKFNGWADKWLATPANGLEDVYVAASANLKAVAGLDTLGFVLSYHDYDAESVSADYGSEWNASVAAKFKKFNFML